MAIDAKPHHYGDGRFPLLWSLIVPVTPRPSFSLNLKSCRPKEVAASFSLEASSDRLSVYDRFAESVRYHVLREKDRKRYTSDDPARFLQDLDVSGDFPYSMSRRGEGCKKAFQKNREKSGPLHVSL